MEWTPILILFLLFFSGIPIAYALLGAALFYFCVLNQEIPIAMLFDTITETVKNQELWALLLFMLASSVLRYSGVGKRLHRLAESLVGHWPGSLAQVNVVWSMLMGGVSGSANADAAMQSQLLVPEMESCGYSKCFSTAITAASSAVTPIIPPGINLLVYAALTASYISVGRMFAAGILPGVLMAAALMAAVAVISKKRNYPAGRSKRAESSEILTCLKHSVWGLLYPFGIILGLMSDVFTIPEVAFLALLYSIFIGSVCYKELKTKYLLMILRETIEAAAGVFLIILAARLFQLYLNCEAVADLFTAAVPAALQNRAAMLLLVNVLLLVLGLFFEGGAILIVMAPLLLPVVSAWGVDPIHFGVICVMNTTIGGLTPPFGSMMLTCCSITGCPLKTFVKECVPFIFVLILALLLVTYIPIVAAFF